MIVSRKRAKVWAKAAIRSRTMLLAAALAAAGVVQAQLHVFQQFLTPEWQGWITLLVGVAVAVLRVLTTEPLVRPSEPPPPS